MSRKNKINLFKLMILIIVLIIIIGIFIYLIPVMKNLSTIEGQETFKTKVEEAGFWGLLMLFGLQVAQIFLFILPGEPIEILAGMCYGGWGRINFYNCISFYYNSSNFLFSKKIRKEICI